MSDRIPWHLSLSFACQSPDLCSQSDHLSPELIVQSCACHVALVEALPLTRRKVYGFLQALGDSANLDARVQVLAAMHFLHAKHDLLLKFVYVVCGTAGGESSQAVSGPHR